MAFVRLLGKLMKTPELGKRIVPIIPDEARTFGMESMFRTYGIYASHGQLYKPHDADDAPLLQGSEGRPDSRRRHHRSRSMAEFTAAGTAYANYGVDTIRSSSIIRCSVSSA